MKRESYGLDDLYRDSSCTSFAVIPMMAFPKQVKISSLVLIVPFLIQLVRYIYLWGWRFFCFVMYIAFGKYGNVTLGKASDKPEFNTFTWAAMLFCAGIGSDILYWGVIEWAFTIKFHQMARKV